MVAMVATDLFDMAALCLILAPSQHYSLVGQEHDRTIPLGDFADPDGFLWEVAWNPFTDQTQLAVRLKTAQRLREVRRRGNGPQNDDR
jgi:hypothetical protein